MMLEEQQAAAAAASFSSKALFLVAVFALSFVLLYLSTTDEHQQQFLIANSNLYSDANTMVKQVQVSHGFLRITVDLGLELPEKMRNIPIDAIVHHTLGNNATFPPKLRYFKQQLRGMRVRLNVYFYDDGINCTTATEHTLGRWSHANQLHIFLPFRSGDACEAMFQGNRMELTDFKWEILDGSVRAHELDVRQVGPNRIRAGVELNAIGSKEPIFSNLFLIPVPPQLQYNSSSSKKPTTFSRMGFWATGNLPKQVGIVVASQLQNYTNIEDEEEEATFIIHSVQWKTVRVAEWFDAAYRHVEIKLDPMIEIKESNAFVGMFVKSPSIRSINMDSYDSTVRPPRRTTTAAAATGEYFKLIRPITQDHFTRSLVVKMQRVMGSMPMFNLL